LTRQVCQITGGPCKYGEELEAEIDRDDDGTVEADEVCQGMMQVHSGLGISQNDYNDLAGDLVAALNAAGVTQPDVDAIATTLTAPALVGQIVEDANNNATVYQRVGRKPAITTVVGDFVTRVVSDNSLVGFFGNLNVFQTNRLRACLVRQVCNIDGPCRYGQEVLEPVFDLNNNAMLDPAEVCKDMLTSHAGLVNPLNGNAAITYADFTALVGHLSMSLTMAGVDNGDRDAVINALAPLCDEIVAGATGCP
jgi:hemoglobin